LGVTLSGNQNIVPGEVLFEFTRMGPQMRVAAIHAATGVEVVVITPANSPRLQMQQVALAKLKRRIERESQG